MRRVPYAEASRALLRDSVLDAMRELLGSRDWSAITLADVARAAGISRQTIYNEFGSRHGLAQGYALRLADRLVDAVEDAIYANVGDVYAAFLQGFRAFFADSAADPLVISLLTGVAKPDLLQIITTDSGPIITHCSARLTSSFMHSWMRASEEDSGMIARATVRLAMSYVSMPPEADHDVAADLARLMTPAAERYGELRDDAGALGPLRSGAIGPGRDDAGAWAQEERSHRRGREDFDSEARGGTTGEPGEAN
jgi:AcrR family transcriptional regulator